MKASGMEIEAESNPKPCGLGSLLVSDLIETLRSQAEEIRREDINGWGNTMEFAADTLEKYANDTSSQSAAGDSENTNNAAPPIG